MYLFIYLFIIILLFYYYYYFFFFGVGGGLPRTCSNPLPQILVVCPKIDKLKSNAMTLGNLFYLFVTRTTSAYGTAILGFHVTSQALLKLVSAMLVPLGCQIYANNRPFLQ